MTLQKAIEILEGSYYKHTILLAGRDDEALKLGIEALKFTLAVRGTILSCATLPLPDETTE